MVTTTTKTLNYSIIRGNHTNSVNATITSTPGFNVNYFGKIPGILKVVELVLAAIGIGLIGSRREERRLGEPHSVPGTTQIVIEATSFPREMFLPGEVYYLCAHSVAMAVLLVVVMTYFTHTVSSMLVPKGTALEMKMNTALALVLLIAGIVEIVQTEQWKMNESGQSLMTGNEYAVRIAGGVVALLNGVLCIISFVLSYLELRGPKTD